MKSAIRNPQSAIGLTLVCFALETEARAFRKLRAGRADVCILITGIGQKNAERAVRSFLHQNSPCRVFTCGFAGGLDPELKIGDVVFETPDANSSAALLRCGARGASFHCAARVATSAMEKTELRHTTGKDAVEMESETIQAVCREREIPCATVRVISDTVHEDLPLDFNWLTNPDRSLNFGKLALAIVESPGKIPALLRLQKNTSFAAMRLAEVLSRVTRP